MIILYYPQNTLPRMGRIPLSVLALGAVLEGKHPYVIVDGNVDRKAKSTLSKIIGENNGQAYLCVSVMPGTQMLNAIVDCRELKRNYPKLIVIWGGYFPSMHTDAVLNSSYVDYVVKAQGEVAFPMLLNALINDVSVDSISNLVYRQDDQFVHNPESPIFDPNNRPELPYHQVNMEAYALPTFVGKRTFCHETSVGCPHKCNFCGVVDVFHSRWKAEKPEQTLAVIRRLKKSYGMDSIEFHDSEMFASENRVAELSRKLVDERIKWWAEGRVDTLLSYDRETWRVMRDSGLRMIFFGAESGLDDTLKLMDKGGVTRDKIKAVAAVCKEFGVQSEFSFVMGSNPGRTEEDIDATIGLMYELEEINPNSQMHPFIYTPVPFGTIYDAAVEGGLTYPKNLDAWADHEWTQYTLRRNPHTPWLTKRLHRKIINFRAVHQSYYPKTNDREIAGWKLWILKKLSSWRYKFRFHTGAYELRALLRLLVNPSPRHEGF